MSMFNKYFLVILLATPLALVAGCTTPTYDLAVSENGIDTASDVQIHQTQNAKIEIVPLSESLAHRPEILVRITNLDDEVHTISPDQVSLLIDGQTYTQIQFSNLRDEIERSAEAQRLALVRDMDDQSDRAYANLGSSDGQPDHIRTSDEVGIAYNASGAGRSWVSSQHQLERIDRNESIELARLQANLLSTTELDPQSAVEGRVVFQSLEAAHESMAVHVEIEFAGEIHRFDYQASMVQDGRFETLISQVWPLNQ